jgi:integrase/recombinase XerD
VQALIDDFLDTLALERGASRHTVTAYRLDLAALAGFLEAEGLDPDRLRGPDLEPYAAALRGDGLAPATVRRRLAAARSFLRHRVRAGDRVEGVRDLPLPRVPRAVPRVLTIDQVEELLDSPDGSPRGLRDRLALELLYGAGLRVSELVGLRPGDVDRELGVVRCIGKGDRERIVPTGRAALGALDRYLARGRPHLGRTQARDALVVNARGRRLSRQGAFDLVRRHAGAVGLPDWVTPHSLRHAFATHLVEGGCDLRTVQELLGHRRIATTEVYTHLAGTHLRETFLGAHPRAR